MSVVNDGAFDSPLPTLNAAYNTFLIQSTLPMTNAAVLNADAGDVWVWC